MSHLVSYSYKSNIITTHTLTKSTNLADILNRRIIADLVNKLLQILTIGIWLIISKECGLIHLLDFINERESKELLIFLEILMIEAILLVWLVKINGIGDFFINVPAHTSGTICSEVFLCIVRHDRNGLSAIVRNTVT